MTDSKSIVFNGYSFEELTNTYRYDSGKGKLYSVATGRQVGYTTHRGYFVSKRTNNKVTSLRVGQLCWLLHYKQLPSGDVKYKDGNIYNIRIDNLFVAQRGGKTRTGTVSNSNSWVDSIEDGILYNELLNLWCVRRGKKNAVYWSKSLEEAISVRNDYLSGDKPLRRDFYHDKYQ